MTEPQIGTGLTDIKVETNFTPAPVEQKSTKITTPEVVTEPEILDQQPEETTLPEAAKEPVKVESSADDKANESARKALEDRIRADRAEAELKKLQPKISVPDKAPDINDQKTWGDKYKNSPNDLETFLQARDDWAIAQGEKRAQDNWTRQKQEDQQRAVQAAVMQKINDSRVKHNDFDAVVRSISATVDSSPILTDFLAKNPMGMEVIYELGKNPAVLQTIMQGDMWTAGEQLMSMAARLKKPAAPQITNAPEPITPVGSRETIKPKVADMAARSDLSDYMTTMNKRELARRRAN